MASEKVMQVISVIIFLTGIICLGGVLAFILWTGLMEGWDPFYTWLVIIGLPCLVVGTILVNKYLKSY